jgi:uncharacterized protein YndB with AHSA1/START domain
MVSFRIRIDAPPEAVFDELSHVERHPSWANPKAEMQMEQVKGGDPGPQSTYRSKAIFINKAVSADISVTAYDPPRRFAIRSDQHQEGKKDIWYQNDYRLTPDGDGTLITKTVTGSGNPIPFYLAYPAIRADQMTSLRNLKRTLESTG